MKPGNVFCKRYDALQVVTDAEVVSDVAEGLEALAIVQAALPALPAATPVTSSGGGDGPGIDDIEAFVAWMRGKYGTQLVPTRLAAEDAARGLLDAHAGSMTEQQARELGALLNSGDWNGTAHHNRFSPAFVGASLKSLIEPLDEFNKWTAKLWTTSEFEAMELVAQLVADRRLFPGAGTSYPTALMYLRDRSKYAVWLKSTESSA